MTYKKEIITHCPECKVKLSGKVIYAVTSNFYQCTECGFNQIIKEYKPNSIEMVNYAAIFEEVL